MTEQAGDGQTETLGSFIRSKRKLANMSLRQLAERTRLSNPYLSQIERGLHQPSVRVIRLISDALNVSTETLLAQAGLLRHDRGGDAAAPVPGVEEAVRADQPAERRAAERADRRVPQHAVGRIPGNRDREVWGANIPEGRQCIVISDYASSA